MHARESNYMHAYMHAYKVNATLNILTIDVEIDRFYCNQCISEKSTVYTISRL